MTKPKDAGGGKISTQSKGKGGDDPAVLSVGPLVNSLMQKNPTLLLDAVKDVTNAVAEWQVIKEQETTKREDIHARRDVALERLRQQGQLMEQFLTRSFDKQDVATRGLLNLLDQALDKGDPAILAQLLATFVSTVKASPLGDLATLDQRMEDGNFTLRLGGKSK